MISGSPSEGEPNTQTPGQREGVLHLGATSFSTRVLNESPAGWRVSTNAANVVPCGLTGIFETDDGCRSEVLIVYGDHAGQGAELCLRRTDQSKNHRTSRRSPIPTTWALTALLLGAALGLHIPLVKWCQTFFE